MKIRTSSAKEDIYIGMENSFYLEDLSIINHNVEENTMFGRAGELSWEELNQANWSLNISGMTLPLAAPVCTAGSTVSTAAATSVPMTMTMPPITAISMPPIGAIAAPPVSAISTTSTLPLTNVMYSTPPPRPTAPLRMPTPVLTNTTVRAPTPNRGNHPAILRRIQESLQ